MIMGEKAAMLPLMLILNYIMLVSVAVAQTNNDDCKIKRYVPIYALHNLHISVSTYLFLNQKLFIIQLSYHPYRGLICFSS